MKLMKCLTLTQQFEKRDDMQSFRSMNSNYITEKIFFFQNTTSYKTQFLQSLNDLDAKQSKLSNFPIFFFKQIFEYKNFL
jgi:hypothetical protein